MEIREHIIIPLGYGKFVRADRIIALEPIEYNRGPGRRTKIYFDQMPNPMIASRTNMPLLQTLLKRQRKSWRLQLL